MKGFNLRRNIASAAVQTLLQTVLLFALYRYLIDTIGVSHFGVWSVVLATASVSQIGNFGLAGSVTKFVAQYHTRGDLAAVSQVIQTAAISIALFLGIVLAIAYPLLWWLLSFVLPSEVLLEGRAILPYALTSLWLTALGGVFQSGLDGVFRTDFRAAVVVAGIIFYFLACFIWVRVEGLMGLAKAQNLQAGVVLLVTWVLLRRSTKSLPVWPYQWSTGYFKEMLGYGLNLQINTIALMLFEPTVKALLSRFGGVAQVGYFEMALRAVMRVRSTLMEINRVLVPVFAGLVESDKQGVDKLYKRNLSMLFSIATPLFAAMIGVAPVISELWLGYYQSSFTTMLCVLNVSWYFNVLCGPAYFAYLGSGRLRWNSISHVIMGLINLMLGIVLGEYWGGMGVVAAFALAILIGSIICPLAYHHEQGIDYRMLFSRSDCVMGLWCSGGAIAALSSYFYITSLYGQDAHLARVLSPVAIASIFCIAAISMHPISNQWLVWVRARLGVRANET